VVKSGAKRPTAAKFGGMNGVNEPVIHCWAMWLGKAILLNVSAYAKFFWNEVEEKFG